MADPQDRAESLDDDKVSEDFPPEEPYGVDAYGTTAAEERWDEPLDERVAREEPEEIIGAGDDVREEGSLDLMQPDAGISTDTEAQEIATLVTGDDTIGDTALEREGVMPAEVAAIHVVDDPDDTI